jgi:hypothetical protein
MWEAASDMSSHSSLGPEWRVLAECGPFDRRARGGKCRQQAAAYPAEAKFRNPPFIHPTEMDVD